MKEILPTQRSSGRKATVSTREVSSPQDLQRFIDFPYRLYKDCPYWIPPIKKAEAGFLIPKKILHSNTAR